MESVRFRSPCVFNPIDATERPYPYGSATTGIVGRFAGEDPSTRTDGEHAMKDDSKDGLVPYHAVAPGFEAVYTGKKSRSPDVVVGHGRGGSS